MDNRKNVTITTDNEDTNNDFDSITSLAIAIVVMTVPGLTANSLAFYCIIPDIQKKKTLIKLLVLALCVADFCGCIGVFCYQVVNLVHHTSKLLCACVSFITVYFPILSGSIATFMAAERCVALRAPFWYRGNMHTWKFWAPFACVILLITVVCFFPIAGLGQVVIYTQTGNETYAKCKPFPKKIPTNAYELRLVLVELGVDYIASLDIISYTLMGVNFVVDPIIYLIMKRKYRERIKRLFCCRTDSDSENSNNSQLRLTTLHTN